MVYVVIGRKAGLESLCVCESRERANIEAVTMLANGFMVTVTETPSLKDI